MILSQAKQKRVQIGKILTFEPDKLNFKIMERAYGIMRFLEKDIQKLSMRLV